MSTISKSRISIPVVDNAAKTARVPLLKFDQVVGWAVIDLDDLPLVTGYRWGMLKSGNTSYAFRQEHIPGTSNGCRATYLHRVILGLPQGTGHGVVADHIDRNGLNDRRSNLRAVTSAENSQRAAAVPTHNTSGAIGVSYVPPRPAAKRRICTTGHWNAYLYRDGEYVHRSSHPTKEAAIAARLQAEADYAARSEGLAS